MASALIFISAFVIIEFFRFDVDNMLNKIEDSYGTSILDEDGTLMDVFLFFS